MGAEKKVLHASEQDRPDVPQARAAHRASFADTALERLVFVDESGVNLAMARRYGRAFEGQRAVGAVPKNWGGNVTLCAALTVHGLQAPLWLPGAMTGEAFVAWVEQFLAPTLLPGQVVVMDNLSAHKSLAVARAIEACGATRYFLPPYSPDLSPIELAWSKVKTVLRAMAARTLAELEEAVEVALRAITPEDARAWFRHDGYIRAPFMEPL